MTGRTSESDERSGGSPTLVDSASVDPASVDPVPADTAARRQGASDGEAKARWWSRARTQIVRRHSIGVEIIVMVCLYAVYDSARGVVGGGDGRAYRDARNVAHLEHELHIFSEPRIQSALAHIPGINGIFAVGYSTFHLGVTALVLGWLYYRRPHVFARIRTLLTVTSVLAVIGFAFFPTAPPRLAGVGIKDTLHIGKTTAESGVWDWLYNPYAAVPSLHMAFAVIAGGSLVVFARWRWMRLVGVAYPIFIAAEVIGTGNHFIFDVVTGMLTAAVALVVTVPLAGEGIDRHLGHTLRLIGSRSGDLFRPAGTPSAALHHETH
jgi:hypothetical protein